MQWPQPIHIQSSSCQLTRLFATSVLLLIAVVPRILPAQSEVTPAVERLYAEAKAAQQQGDDATAIEKYRNMLKLAPHLAPAYNNLGMLYFNDHDYANAAKVLQRGLDLNPHMPTASAMLGMSYFQLGENAKAEPLLQEVLRTKPDDDRIEMMLVHIYISGDKYDDAVLHLKSILARHPKDQDAWYLLGKTYLRMSQDSLKKIDEIDPDSVVAHIITGEIDQSMHNYDLALVEYKKAVDKAPNQPGTHMHMGDAYWYMGKWEAAQTEFKAELVNDPNNCIARWKLGNAILEANDSSNDALTQLNQVIERCPNLMQARVDRARALVRLDKQPEALPDLLLAEKDSPNEPTIHFLLAAVYRAQGKSEDARKEMATYSKLQREASATVAQQAADAEKLKNSPQ